MESMTGAGKIVRAAFRLFAERGYAAVSIDDIATQAGLTKGAVYHSFRSKRELFLAACTFALDQIVDRLEDSLMDEIEHTLDEIVTGGERLFDAYEDPRFRQLLLIDGPAVLGIEDWTRMQERLRVELGEHALGHLADAGLIEPRLVPMTAHLLFGAFSQGVLQIAGATDPCDASALAREAYRKLAQGLVLQPVPPAEDTR